MFGCIADTPGCCVFGVADDFEEKMRRILDEWQFEGIIPCHGDVLNAGGKAALKAHLGL